MHPGSSDKTPVPRYPVPAPPDAAGAAYWASVQDENGVDLTLIRDNLRRSPAERLQRAERAYWDILRLRLYARRISPDTP